VHILPLDLRVTLGNLCNTSPDFSPPHSIIWSPHFKGDVDAIEKVQRRFTKCIWGL